MSTVHSKGDLHHLVIPKERVQLTRITLGRGSYGKVSLVEYDGTVCACKQLRTSILQREDERAKRKVKVDFLRECHLWSKLRHPNVVQFLGVFYPTGDESGLPFMVMEKMKKTLTTVVKKYPDIPLLVKLSLLHDVVLGLRYLHAHKPPILHRDLSPNNILVTSHLEAKITDLGLAKGVLMKDTNKLTKAPGTLHFMPPEALEDKPTYGTPLDMFSFGGVVCYVASGKWPVPKATKQRDPTTKKIMALSEVQKRQQYIDDMTGNSKDLQPLAESCLDEEPDDRPSAKKASEDIEKLLEVYKKRNDRDGIGPALWLAEMKCKQEAAKAAMQLYPETDALPDLFNEPVKTKWRDGASLPLSFTGGIAVMLHDVVYIGGGVGSKQGPLFEIDTYYPKANKWGPTIDCPQSLFAMTVFADQLVIAGGKTASTTNPVTGDMFTLEKHQWKNLSTMPTPKWGTTAVCYKTKIAVVGGKGKDNTTLNTTELLDTATGQWHTCNSLPQPVSFAHSISINNKVYVLGGLNKENQASQKVFSASTDSLSNGNQLAWISVEDMPWPDSVVVGLEDSHLVAVGGAAEHSTVCAFNSHSSFTMYSLWEAIGVIPVPTSIPAAVGIDNEIFVFGGATSGNQFSNVVQIGTIVIDN